MDTNTFFFYAKTTKDVEFFEICKAGFAFNNQIKFNNSMEYKILIHLTVDRTLITKVEVLSILKTVLNLDRAMAIERFEIPDRPFIQLKLGNDAFQITVEKMERLPLQELAGIMESFISFVDLSPTEGFLPPFDPQSTYSH